MDLMGFEHPNADYWHSLRMTNGNQITKNMLGLHHNGTLICLVCPAYTPLQGDRWTPTMAWRRVHRWSSASQSLEECGEVQRLVAGCLKSQDQGMSAKDRLPHSSSSITKQIVLDFRWELRACYMYQWKRSCGLHLASFRTPAELQ